MGPSPHLCFFFMQNSDFRTSITCLYGSQTSPMDFCIQNSDFSTRITSLYWSQPSSVVFACKTTTFGSELQVSMGISPHLWLMYAKQRLYDQNFKSLWVPDLTYGFCMQNSDFSIRITILYGSQPSFVVLCIQNSDFRFRINSLYGSQLSFVAFVCKTATLVPE